MSPCCCCGLAPPARRPGHSSAPAIACWGRSAGPPAWAAAAASVAAAAAPPPPQSPHHHWPDLLASLSGQRLHAQLDTMHCLAHTTLTTSGVILTHQGQEISCKASSMIISHCENCSRPVAATAKLSGPALAGGA